MQIEGMAAVVTGAASGLGAAVAEMLLAGGARVAMLDINGDQGDALSSRMGGLFLPTDVTEEKQIIAALDAAEAAHGPARILVNCAGVAPALKAVSRDGDPLSLESYRRVIDINLIGTFSMLSHFAARAMAISDEDAERAVIINTASIAAFDGQIGHAAYSASKAGIVGMTLPLAREFARARIRVMTVAPGLFETPILAGIAEAASAAARHVQHPARMGAPAEFAALVREIIANPMLNGDCIRIDGAVRLPPR
ncbi:SDR family NAD(P)-dependent oxidoreductase [Sphingobium phenoxybenzoativorans]|uniref:SDR family NAD(P)-dependent oxidoreductase n=1 Tax=Sphingobium phenoxybenzoativorans TaxID=1592790 RepID=A0A975Q1G3_9SPHN|nr:SDR family NAD(P)-dependent oxidoreductase [Sphingobium phenoxybenzoativorans]QUT05784.1 SDR family NAD(P)-dependent oxidoreductase [Sphingobium phenoxybenzoativorans]